MLFVPDLGFYTCILALYFNVFCFFFETTRPTNAQLSVKLQSEREKVNTSLFYSYFVNKIRKTKII